MKNIFIIGSKGIPANYGGFETFVEELTKGQKKTGIKYHVACMSDNFEEFKHNGARCFNVSVPNIGPAKAVYYDIKALECCLKYIEKNNVVNPIIYVLACRIGPFIGYYKKQLKKFNGELFVNPDGHEWKRAKWNRAIRAYWKISEKYMVKHADLLVCDSKNIEKYIKEDYKKFNPNTTFIAYGATINDTSVSDTEEKVVNWYKEKNVTPNEYYLVVGRFVPENNYELMIREFMKSKTKKDFVLITNVEKNAFYEELKAKTGFDKDERIKFVGTVYNQELLTKIRANAFGYFHGHEVGGTNPSLLEALATTDLNLLLNVGFNKEVAEDSAIYFEKDNMHLANIINSMDSISKEEIDMYGNKAKERINSNYTWDKIIKDYENLFLNNRG